MNRHRLMSIPMLLLLIMLAGCATAAPSPAEKSTGDPIVNLSPASGETGELIQETIESESLALGAAAAADAGDRAAEVVVEVEVHGETAMVESLTVQQQAALKAGEVDDNDQWDDYLLYRRQIDALSVHDVDVSERYPIIVRDAAGETVHDARVRVSTPEQELLFEAVADASGRVLFHPRVTPLSDGIETFVVQASDPADPGNQLTVEFPREPVLAWELALPGRQAPTPVQLDILFLIDTTGSMQDEIDALKSTILEISAQIDVLPEQPDVRFGMVIYRDRGDSFVTRSFDFVPEVEKFHRQLQGVTANGGDDYPEALNEGLHAAIHEVAWRESKTVRLVFLIADAPPHLDYAQDYDYAEEMALAAGRGIKIFPIASSGLDDQGEYIYRQLAQFTGGKFIFLTYSAGGSGPGGETSHHVEDYSVENLDALVIRLVKDELAKLSR